jgi:hypothetical protein
MKTNIVRTFSLTLLLSTPLALQALPGDPYAQQAELNAHIATLNAPLTDLRTQLTTPAVQQDAKKTNDIKLAIQFSEAKIKEEQAKLPALAARIKTLEPSADKMETLGKLRHSIPGIQGWAQRGFKVCETTEVAVELDLLFKTADTKEDKRIFREDTSKLPYLVAHKALLVARKAQKNYTLETTPVSKTTRNTVEQSDKSAPKVTKAEYTEILRIRAEEEAKRKNNSWTAWGQYAKSLVTSTATTSATTPQQQQEDDKN